MTRGEVKIIDGETDLVNLYIHSDMYPSGIMIDGSFKEYLEWTTESEGE